MNIAELGLAVHSDEAVKATTDLDRLTEAADRAEKSAAGLANEVEQLDKSLSGGTKAAGDLATAEDALARSVDSANDRIKDMVKASLESSEYHQSLAASVTGTSAAMDGAKSSATNWAAYQEEISARGQALLETEARRIDSAGKMVTATKKEEESLQKLLGAIDPAQAAIAKLDKQVEELGKQFEAGSIDLETYTKGLEHFDGKYAEIEKTSNAFSKLNLHTKSAQQDVMQLGNALTSGNWQSAVRNVTSLGVGAGASATSLLAMAAPVALVAGALGGLTYAYFQGRKEQDAYNQGLILTGNYAGTTSSQLSDMARQVSTTVGTTGAAAAALAQLAGGGKIAGESFEMVATAALQMEQATGRAVDQTIAEFVRIADDPVAAARALNDQYNFLTAATYSQIVALEEQGNTIGAAKLLTDEYANTIASRSAEIGQDLGYVERAWNAVKGAGAGALDSVKSLGREKGFIEELIELRKELENPTTSVTVAGPAGAVTVSTPVDEKAILKRIDFLEMQKEADKQRVRFLKEQSETEKEVIDAMARADALAKSSLTNEERRTEAIKEYREQLDTIRKDNPDDDRLNQLTIDKNIASINARYRGSTAAGGGADLSGFNAAKNQLSELLNAYKTSNKELEAQQRAGVLSQSEYLTQRTELIHKEREEVAEAYQAEIDALEAAKGKKDITAAQVIQLDQRIGAARTAMVKAQQDADSQLNILAINEKGRLEKQEVAIQSYVDALDRQADALRRQGERAATGLGMGDRQASLSGALDSIEDRANQQRLDLARDQADKARNMSAEEYQQKLDAINRSERELAEVTISNYELMSEAQEDWRNGATAAYENYLESARDVSAQTKNLFTSAFSSMEDAIVNFAMTGKLSFADFTKSILADMARIAARQASSSLLSSLVGAGAGYFTGGGVSSAGSTAAGYTGSEYSNWLATQALGGAWDSGVQMFAKGGAFTNSVVSQPTAFGMAGGVGVMGEAGPEAIMPLARASDGSLGVRAAGGGAGSTAIHVTVHVDSEGGVSTSSNAAGLQQFGDELGRFVEQKHRQLIQRDLRADGAIGRQLGGRR